MPRKDKEKIMAESRKPREYGDQSITSLKGADRVRKRPSVIFGSDGLEGCQHSFFEILANSADEARAGYGDKMKKRVDGTGNWSSVNSMLAVSMIPTQTAPPINIPSV